MRLQPCVDGVEEDRFAGQATAREGRRASLTRGSGPDEGCEGCEEGGRAAGGEGDGGDSESLASKKAEKSSASAASLSRR